MEKFDWIIPLTPLTIKQTANQFLTFDWIFRFTIMPKSFNYSFWFQELDDVYHNVSAVVAETLIQAADVSALKVKIFTSRPPEAAILSPFNAICGHITSTCFLSVRWNEPEIRKIRHFGQSHQSTPRFKRLRQDSQHSRIHDCVKACIFATQSSRSGSGMFFWTEGGKGQN